MEGEMSYTSYYWSATGNIALSCTIFELGLEIIHGH